MESEPGVGILSRREPEGGADLWNANLKEALYEPQLGTLPEILSLRTAKNLETMRFDYSPHAMEDLRREFRNVGFKNQERQITFAIKRSEQRNAWQRGEYLESCLNHMFFNLPVAYGLYPGRPLRILLVIMLAMSLAYLYALTRLGPAGIWAVWSSERVNKSEGEENAVRLTVESLLFLVHGFSIPVGRNGFVGPVDCWRGLILACCRHFTSVGATSTRETGSCGFSPGNIP